MTLSNPSGGLSEAAATAAFSEAAGTPPEAAGSRGSGSTEAPGSTVVIAGDNNKLAVEGGKTTTASTDIAMESQNVATDGSGEGGGATGERGGKGGGGLTSATSGYKCSTASEGAACMVMMSDNATTNSGAPPSTGHTAVTEGGGGAAADNTDKISPNNSSSATNNNTNGNVVEASSDNNDDNTTTTTTTPTTTNVNEESKASVGNDKNNCSRNVLQATSENKDPNVNRNMQLQTARKDQFLQTVLRVTVADSTASSSAAAALSAHTPIFFLASHARELDKQGKPRRLSMDDLEEILIRRVRSIGVDGTENVFRYLSNCYHRSTDEVCCRCLPTSQRAATVQELQRQLVNHAVLLLSCPELFELATVPPHPAVQQQLTQFLEGGCPASFFNRFTEELQQQSTTLGVDLLTQWLTPVFEALSEALNTHSMNEYKSPAFNAIKFLCSHKPIAAVAAESSVLLPVFRPPFPTTKPGFYLQEHSLLGRIYSATLLDGPMLRSGGSTESLSMKYFAGTQLLTLQYLNSTVQTLRHDEQSLQEGAAAIVKSLCRAGSNCRRRVLEWFGKVASSNELRAKVGHMLSVTQPRAPESLDPMHAMLLKAQGQTTYGFSLNIFWAVLALVEPIKMEKMADLCYFYSFRTDTTAQQLLGEDLRRDARLGDEAAVAAARRYCDTHNILTTEPKFSAEVFWLALKSIRVLFNPSVTEFTRILQKLQGVHDRGVSPTAPEYRFLVAEVMSWRTVLLHPRFCSLFWNLLHLVLAWLLRCMYLFDSNGNMCPEQVAFLTKHANRFAALVTHTTPPAVARGGSGGAQCGASAMRSSSSRSTPTATTSVSPAAASSSSSPSSSQSSSSVSPINNISTDQQQQHEQQQQHSSNSSTRTTVGSSRDAENIALPPQFAALPSCIVDDTFASIRRVLKLQSVYLSVRGSQGIEQPPVAPADTELIAAACIAVMRSAAFFRNVHTRCDGACKTLYLMFLTEGIRGRLEETPVVREHLFAALTDVFIASERGSYYDRITFRIPIVDLSQKLLVLPDFKRSLHQLATASPEKFIHMIHLLLNDVSTLVDQAVSALMEVRRRQLAGKDHDEEPQQQQHSQGAGGGAATTATPGAPGAGGGATVADERTAAGGAAVSGAAVAGGGSGGSGVTTNAAEGEAAIMPSGATAEDEDEEEDEEDADEDEEDAGASLEGNAQLRRESWSRLEATARDLCSLGFNACSLFTLYAKECGSYIIESPSILPQAVTTLDCCLDHLVGPRCLQLKVNHMESYNFKPKDWLMKVLESYVYLLQADPEGGASLIGEILKDGRYFKKETANKAYRIAKREGLMNMQLLEKFQEMVKKLSEGMEDDFDFDVEDFPAEYLDPIMADIMTDPVKLPTSNNVMDRKHIERHLMSEPSDPFNRIPLTKEDLIPMPELKVEILAFIAQKKAAKNRM